MAAFIAFLLVVALGAAGYLGAEWGLQYPLGVVVPYAAVLVFVAGFIFRILDWAKSPVPFRIPTTGGQQKSHPWIKRNAIDNPVTPLETVVRMALEVLTFRSLMRNTTVKFHSEGRFAKPGDRVSYTTALTLWLFAILFHYSFLIIFARHFRLFLEPVPVCIAILEFLDGIMQIGAPRMYMTDVLVVAALTFLLGRRFFNAKVRYISLLNDYFPLLLILAVCLSGIWMRYFGKTDIASVKVLTMGLVTLSPVTPEGVGAIFYMHLFLVCSLLVYFPFSKLMHMGGVFFSPTRNLPNDSRIHRHINPWNPPKKYHTYEAYEDDFREPMFEAGLPLEKQPDAQPADESAE